MCALHTLHPVAERLAVPCHFRNAIVARAAVTGSAPPPRNFSKAIARRAPGRESRCRPRAPPAFCQYHSLSFPQPLFPGAPASCRPVAAHTTTLAGKLPASAKSIASILASHALSFPIFNAGAFWSVNGLTPNRARSSSSSHFRANSPVVARFSASWTRGYFSRLASASLNKRGGGSRLVFLQMHKRPGQLDQPLVKRAVRPVPVLKPEMLQHVMGLIKLLAIETVEIAEIMRIQLLPVMPGHHFGNAFALAHGFKVRAG